jgi:hypothetical protein
VLASLMPRYAGDMQHLIPVHKVLGLSRNQSC